MASTERVRWRSRLDDGEDAGAASSQVTLAVSDRSLAPVPLREKVFVSVESMSSSRSKILSSLKMRSSVDGRCSNIERVCVSDSNIDAVFISRADTVLCFNTVGSTVMLVDRSEMVELTLRDAGSSFRSPKASLPVFTHEDGESVRNICDAKHPWLSRSRVRRFSFVADE